MSSPNNEIRLYRIYPKWSTWFLAEQYADRPCVGVEIGTWEGKNAYHLLNRLAGLHLYVVDPYSSTDDSYDEQDKKDASKQAMNRMICRLQAFPRRVIHLRRPSPEALDEFEGPDGFDFIYVDGNHSYEAVKDDLKASWPLIKDGGWLVGDDVAIFGVSRAVIEFCDEHRLTPLFESGEFAIQKGVAE